MSANEFDTSGPARVDVYASFGSVRVVTSDRSTTAVSVAPSNPDRRKDVEAAEQTRVHHTGAGISVTTPSRRSLGMLVRPGSVDILIAAPLGSSVSAETGFASFAAQGRLNRCDVRSSYGDVHIEQAQEARVKTSGGHISVGVVSRGATISNSYAAIRVGEARGACNLTNSSGEISVGVSRGEVRIRSAYGQVSVERAVEGLLEVVTSYGAADVAIVAGTATQLDVSTTNGHISNSLTPTGAPADPSRSLQLRLRSGWGDLAIRRVPQMQGDLP